MKDYYYISSGAKNMMHTLRYVYEDFAVIEGEKVVFERDNYVVNLSVDFDSAVEKAKVVAGDDFREGFSFSLEDIKRRNEEEMRLARLADAAKEVVAAEEKEERDSVYRRDAYEVIASGEFPFGKYKTYEFEEADSGYIRFMGMVEVENNKEGRVMRFLQKVLKKKFPDLFVALPEANGEYYGEPKKREKMVATVVEMFGFDGFYGYTHVVKMVKDSGELLMYMGSALPGVKYVEDVVYLEGSAEEYVSNEERFDSVVIGSAYEFNATVKEHEEYKGEKQTKVQRLAKVAKAA